jgi:hypothetical protein
MTQAPIIEEKRQQTTTISNTSNEGGDDSAAAPHINITYHQFFQFVLSPPFLFREHVFCLLVHRLKLFMRK